MSPIRPTPRTISPTKVLDGACDDRGERLHRLSSPHVLEPYLSWCRVERGLAPSTIRAYERELVALGPDDLLYLSSEELRAVVHARAGHPATVARRLAAWRSYYGWAVRSGRRVDDPTAQLDTPKVRRGLPRPVADASRLIAQLTEPYRSIAVLLLETGLRISEACTLDVPIPPPDVLTVRGKGGRERLIPLSGAAQGALRQLGGRVALSPRTIQRRFAEVGISPHRLRHTFATELIASGADIGDVQALLGHASPATTTIYAAYGIERLRAAIDRRGRDT